jgi:hypothetical protein
MVAASLAAPKPELGDEIAALTQEFDVSKSPKG